MSKLSIQLHAMPDEVPVLLANLLSDPLVFVVIAKSTPLQLTQHNNKFPFAIDSDCKAVLFTLLEPTLGMHSLNDFRKLNPDALVFEIGQLKRDELRESWFSAMTDSEAAMTRWKRAAKELQTVTLTGAVAVNPRNGASAPMKGHRHTRAAQESFAKGIVMLPAAGNSVIQLPTADGSMPF
jgi:hypothetical protein